MRRGWNGGEGRFRETAGVDVVEQTACTAFKWWDDVRGSRRRCGSWRPIVCRVVRRGLLVVRMRWPGLTLGKRRRGGGGGGTGVASHVRGGGDVSWGTRSMIDNVLVSALVRIGAGLVVRGSRGGRAVLAASRRGIRWHSDTAELWLGIPVSVP